MLLDFENLYRNKIDCSIAESLDECIYKNLQTFEIRLFFL